MKRFIIMMLALALAFLLTTSFAVTNDNFEFVLPSGYETVEEKHSMGVYKKEGSAFMYAIKSVYDGMDSEVLEFNREELTKLIKDLYEESDPMIESKSTVSLKNKEGVRLDIVNPQGVKSVVFFTNSSSAIIMLAFSGTALEQDIDTVLNSFEVKGVDKQAALIVVGGIVVFVFLLIGLSQRKKK